jgi:hypothetical protein
MRRRRTVAALLATLVVAVVLIAVRAWPPRSPPASPAPPETQSSTGPGSFTPPPGLPPEPDASGALAVALPAPRGALEGTVRSSGTARGIPGAELTFSRAGAAASVRSTADGSFRFEPPEPGRWQLAAAAAPGHAPFAPDWGQSPVAFDARAGQRVSGVSVWLAPEERYAGLVEDPGGKPVEGAEVRVLGSATGDRALLPSAEKAASGPGGVFAIAAPEGATLEARHPGFAPGRAAIDFPARASRRVVVKLGKAGPAPLAAVDGRVTSGGAPVEGALVTARLLPRGGPGSADDVVAAQSTSDAGGRFTLRELDGGRYLLTAVREGFAQPRAVVARGGEEAAIELIRGGRISGVVREAGSGSPVTAFRVVVLRGGRGWKLPIRAATVVDASGRFDLADLPPGPVVLVASSPGHRPSDEVEATVPEFPGVVDAEIRLPPGGRVTGRVTDRASGQPLPGARIALEGDGGGAPSVLDAGATAVSGPDGSFEVGGLSPRAVTLLVSADGHHARIVGGIEVREGGVAGPVEVRLSPVPEGEDPRVELAGIGATLERRGRSWLRITGVVPGGGAAEAGLAPGDEILSVEGRPISELGLSGAVDLIRGPEETRVRLVVKRGDVPAAEVWVWRRLVRG